MKKKPEEQLSLEFDENFEKPKSIKIMKKKKLSILMIILILLLWEIL